MRARLLLALLTLMLLAGCNSGSGMSEEEAWSAQQQAEDDARREPYYPGMADHDPIREAQEDKSDWMYEQAEQERARDAHRYDCGDFTSQRQAQGFYEEQGGPGDDPYVLDADRDGIACELNR